MTGLQARCSLCGEPVDPVARTTYRRIQGWECKALGPTRKGGSDIRLRTHLDEWAHPHCVALAVSGVSVGQTSLV